jgi:hypothetical protein
MVGRRILLLLAATVCLVPLAGQRCSVAGTFSAPQPLPPGNASWHFAVNDRGEGGAVRSFERGALFYALSADGLGAPAPLAIPDDPLGGFALEQSIAIDSQGRLALGLLYEDRTAPSEGQTGHENGGCCSRAAVARWRLGEVPPVTQVLSPRQSAGAGFNHQGSLPLVTIGPRAVTALWVRGGYASRPPEIGEEPENGEAQVMEAYGAFGQPLRVRRLATVYTEIFLPHLSLAGDGSPVATWLQAGYRLHDGYRLVSVKGHPTGDLRGVKHSRAISGRATVQGFAEGSQGDPVLAYSFPSHHHAHELLLMLHSRPGHRVGRAKQIALTPYEAFGWRLSVRGHSLLAGWERALGHVFTRLYVKRGGLGGRLGRVESLGLGEDPHAWFDARGNAVVVYDRPVGRNPDVRELVAVTGAPGRRFGKPTPLLPNLSKKECDLYDGAEPVPIPTSPDGHAVFYVRCSEPADQYLIRYTP